MNNSYSITTNINEIRQKTKFTRKSLITLPNKIFRIYLQNNIINEFDICRKKEKNEEKMMERISERMRNKSRARRR